MRFLIPLFLLLVRFAAAFGDAARSERVFYYYAYLLDAALNPATGPTTIAHNCGREMGIGAKATCSFNDFNKYISALSSPPPDGWSATTDKYPDATTLKGYV